MNDSKYQIRTALEIPDLMDKADAIVKPCWPEFMFHDQVAHENWERLYDDFPAMQFVLIELATGVILATGNSLSFHFDQVPSELSVGGWDWVFQKAVADHEAGVKPNCMCAIQVAIPPEYRGRGLSKVMLNAMRAIARAHGFDSLFAPVRPNQKCVYPIIPMERYITWTNDKGLPFDPWMRVHAGLGASIVKVCHEAMLIEGTVAEWETWANMRFPESGTYTVSGALVPIRVDRETDKATYVEPNVWMHHQL